MRSNLPSTASFLCRSTGLLLLALLASGCGPQAESKAAAKPGGGMPPPEVEVITVARGSVGRTVELPGRAQAVRSAQVRARIEGIVESRLYAEGSDVQAGASLFRLDGRVISANVDSARASLAKVQAEADNAQQALERTQTLAAQKLATQQQLDQAVARQRQALADVGVARAALTRNEIDLSYVTVTAPIGGRIGRALVTEGALVGRGEATHLATIEQLDPILINFSQSSADFLRLRQAVAAGKAIPAKDRTVHMVLENGRDYGRAGKLLFTDLAIDPQNGSVGLRAEFPNPQKLILPGQFVTLRLPVAQAEAVVTVPQRAVQASAQGQVVMVVGADGKVAPRPVTTGGLAGSDWIISEGLQGGEQVIVNGLQKARPGSLVTAVPVGSGAPVAAMSSMAGMVGMAGAKTSMAGAGK